MLIERVVPSVPVGDEVPPSPARAGLMSGHSCSAAKPLPCGPRRPLKKITKKIAIQLPKQVFTPLNSVR